MTNHPADTPIPRLSAAEEALLAAIVSVPAASMDDLIEVMRTAKGAKKNPVGHPSKSVRTLINRMRGKLEPHGIEIETQRKVGYFMTMRNKWRLKKLYTSPDAPPTTTQRVNGSG